MSTYGSILAGHAAMLRAFPTAVVAVVNGANSSNGLMGEVAGQSDLGPHGQMGPRDGTVYVSHAAIGTVTMGSEITVGANVVTVTGVSVDPLGALVTISYRVTRPVVAEAI